MNIFGKRQRGARKALFLCSTILRGFRAKDDNESGGNVEVGPGFAEAAERMSGDDNREPEQRGKGAVQQVDGDDNSGDDDGGDNDGDDNSGDDNGDGDPDEKPKPKKRDTAKYIRDTKRELRQERAARVQLEQRLAALENGGLQKPAGDDNSSDTSGRPDPNDDKKYPLGVLDDGYMEDLTSWKAEQVIKSHLSEQSRKSRAEAEAASAEKHAAELRGHVETLTDKGSEQFDDFETLVVEGGLRGDWQLTETTFTAAAQADNGPAILYALANDTDEAERVSKLSPFEQIKYVATKDAELTGKKPKARTRPAAGEPPANAPRGRNGATPIRADTDNLDDFRKLYYATK